MSYKFFECSSLTSLNLFNFNTNNVNNMSNIFYGLNKNRQIYTQDNKLLQIKKINLVFFFYFN